MTTHRSLFRALAALPLVALMGCSSLQPYWHAASERQEAANVRAQSSTGLLDEIERAHFQYFVEQSDPETGLTRDRSQAEAPASIAAVGFSLTAYPVAARRGWVSRAQAVDYTLRVLKTLEAAPQGEQADGVSGYKGLFYHFIDKKNAARVWKCELSTVDTALLMAGVLFAQSYYDGQSPAESEIRERAERLYRRVDWAWALDGGDRLSLGWHPEKGFLPYHWGGYNEAMIMLLLGLGSPTHPLPAKSWEAYTRSYQVVERYGQLHVPFGPMFGHQYSHLWIDFKGIQDAPMRKLGWDYFENSRRATLAQHAYAIANPKGWKGYGALDWGLTACDGPGEVKKHSAQFHGYLARGAPDDHDDGTIAPTAAAGSLPFAPEVVMPTLMHWRKNRPEIWGRYGFADAFNPSFEPAKPSGWIGPDTLGIDQGPIMLMAENHRTGFIWETMKKNPHVRRGLERAGFTGGWLAR